MAGGKACVRKLSDLSIKASNELADLKRDKGPMPHFLSCMKTIC